jgi:hypothetical protein
MKTHLTKTSEGKKQQTAAAHSNVLGEKNTGVALNDNRSSTLIQKKQIGKMHSPTTIQKTENNTGLPDPLKTGMENLSGMNLNHVKTHYNSSKPAAVQAHAYAQGSEIHLGSGQEKHLPHELAHVVQQAQGRVKPTTSVNGMAVNNNIGLEKEADVMGAKALKI